MGGGRVPEGEGRRAVWSGASARRVLRTGLSRAPIRVASTHAQGLLRSQARLSQHAATHATSAQASGADGRPVRPALHRREGRQDHAAVRPAAGARGDRSHRQSHGLIAPGAGTRRARGRGPGPAPPPRDAHQSRTSLRASGGSPSHSFRLGRTGGRQRALPPTMVQRRGVQPGSWRPQHDPRPPALRVRRPRHPRLSVVLRRGLRRRGHHPLRSWLTEADDDLPADDSSSATAGT